MKLLKDGSIYYEEGDRVILTTVSFINSPNNPRWGGIHGCPGTVSYRNGNMIRVQWDNGKNNTYRDTHLTLWTEDGKLTNPNFSFKVYKIKYMVTK
jgi:hypothetical protein